MSQVFITDTILRDAHQCLIATRLQTSDMLEICSELDDIGYWSLEVWGGATFDACVRFLREDPWERLRQLRHALPNTRLQMLLRGQNLLGYRHYPDDVVAKFVEKSADNGIDIFRIFDALNDVRNFKQSIQAVKKAKKHAQGAIAYTTSPVHELDDYVKLALELQDLGCDSIAIKDMAGLLNPFVCEKLVSALTAKLEIPLHLHSHATSGLASLCQLKAVEHGCYHIDTAISAFAGGASHPATESMVAAFKDTKYDTLLDLGKLQNIAEYFKKVRKKYKSFESDGTGVDTRVQNFQVPGGMISNLYNQLRQQNALDKVDEVLQEIPRVREDLGYPPLVTPTSQVVGTQALLNVVTGNRYKTITNEVKLYLQGKYGKAPGKINAELAQLAIGNEEVIEVRPADLIEPEMDKLTTEIGDLANNVEDVLLYAMFPDVGRGFLQERKEGSLQPETFAEEKTSEESGAINTPCAPTEFSVALHGEEYKVKVTGSGDFRDNTVPFYLTIDGIPEEIILSSDSWVQESNKITGNATPEGRVLASKPGHVSAAMPGKIVDLLVVVGDSVEAGAPLLVIEAMKMETEIQAPVSGNVVKINVGKGDTVNPQEVLLEIE